MKRFQGLALVGAVLFTLSSAAFPQGSSSSLQGTVTDPSGSAIPGAIVVLANGERLFPVYPNRAGVAGEHAGDGECSA